MSMSIRPTSKVILLHKGKILLNRCADEEDVYYDLPGGGQHPLETMEEAAHREVLEETGYSIIIDRFAAITEEISSDPFVLENYPAYAHRVAHIFLAHLASDERTACTETDLYQVASEWFTPEQADQLYLRPLNLNGRFREILNSDHPLYLGSSKD